MARYITQLRRGVRYVDENGATLPKADGTPVRDDWATYTAQENHLNPQDGELVVEFEFNPATGKKTPRFKLGCDNKIFEELEYISPDSFVLPTKTTVTIYGSEDSINSDKNQWVDDIDENGNQRYKQLVDVKNAAITVNSKVDLQPTSEMLAIFHSKDLALVAENEAGVVTVYCVGQKPTNTYTIPCTVTEVVSQTGTIIGNTTATPNPRPDWNQPDSTKADYINNKPIVLTEDEIVALIDSNDTLEEHTNRLDGVDNVLRQILAAIRNSGTTADTIDTIEQLIVSYLETKTVREVEGE